MEGWLFHNNLKHKKNLAFICRGDMHWYMLQALIIHLRLLQECHSHAFNILSSELFTFPVFNHNIWYKLHLQSFHNQHHSGNSTSKDLYGSEWKSWIWTMRCSKRSVRNSSPTAALFTFNSRTGPTAALSIGYCRYFEVKSAIFRGKEPAVLYTSIPTDAPLLAHSKMQWISLLFSHTHH